MGQKGGSWITTLGLRFTLHGSFRQNCEIPAFFSITYMFLWSRTHKQWKDATNYALNETKVSVVQHSWCVKYQKSCRHNSLFRHQWINIIFDKQCGDRITISECVHLNVQSLSASSEATPLRDRTDRLKCSHLWYTPQHHWLWKCYVYPITIGGINIRSIIVLL